MRKLRKKITGAEYHITAKTNGGKNIFCNKEDGEKYKEVFLDVIKRCKKKYNFELRTYCIMSNHIHLVITPAHNEDLSKIMQWILSVFAKKYNKMKGTFGHVWYDRFFSKIIYTYEQRINTIHYVWNNPVKAGIKDKAKDFIYSGLHQLFIKNYEIIEPPDNVTAYCLKCYV